MIMLQEKRYSCSFRHALLAFVLLFVICQNVSATVYYVDADAAGGGDGSLGLPWNTLQQVNDATLVPGDFIRFKRGSIFSAVDPANRMLSITASGTKESPIVFGTYGSDVLPIIDGSQDLNTWTDMGSGIWSHPYPLGDPANYPPNVLHYYGVPKPPITTLQFDSVPASLQSNAILLQLADGFRTLWVKSVNSDANTVSGITFSDMVVDDVVVARQLDANGRQRAIPESPLSKPTIIADNKAWLTESGHWYWDDDTIYLKFVLPPADVQVGYVGDYSSLPLGTDEVRFSCIDIEADYVTITDLRIQKCNESAITIRNSNNITVSGMDISATGIGGIALRNSSNNIIDGNTLDNAGGISVWAYPGYFSQNNDILDNTLSNCRGACIALSTEGASAGADPAEVSGNHIFGNTVNRANTMSYDSAGIYTWYAGSNTIESNEIKDGGSVYLRSAGVMVDVSGGPMTITKNIIENNSQGGVAVSGAGHKITDNILRNNGVDSWGSSQVLFFDADGSTAANCTVTGNTMEADQDHHFILGWPESQSGHVIDNNVYSSPSTKLFSWGTSWSEEWVSFMKWRCNTEHDGSSVLNGVTYSPDVRLCFSLPLFMQAILSGAVGDS